MGVDEQKSAEISVAKNATMVREDSSVVKNVFRYVCVTRTPRINFCGCIV